MEGLAKDQRARARQARDQQEEDQQERDQQEKDQQEKDQQEKGQGWVSAPVLVLVLPVPFCGRRPSLATPN